MRKSVEVIVQQAKSEAQERILRHRDEIADPRVRRLLADLAEHLFPRFHRGGLCSGSGLNLTKRRSQWRGVRGTMIAFRAALGVGPKAYAVRQTMLAALKLVVETDLKIWQIAEFAGYSSPQFFSRVFRQHFGQSPGAMRKALRASGGYPPRVAAAAREGRGSTKAREAVPPDGRLVVHAEPRCRRLAEAVWRWLREVSGEKVRARLRRVVFESPELFHLLGEKALEEGRRDRQRGIEVGELAMACLEAGRKALGAAYRGLRALGQARLSNLHRLALDFPAAVAAMRRADEEWKKVRGSHEPLMEAEIIALKGSLRFSQRRLGEARELLERSIALCRQAPPSRLLAQTLLQWAALMGYQGLSRTNVPQHREALGILEPLDEPRLTLATYMNLAIDQTTEGQPEAAVATLSKARALYPEAGDPALHYQLCWIEGLVRTQFGDTESAESLFKEALSGLNRVGDKQRAAIASLELGILYFQQGKTSMATRYAAEAIPVFEALENYPEAVAAAKLLRGAITESRMTLAVLAEVRELLLKIWRAPAPA